MQEGISLIQINDCFRNAADLATANLLADNYHWNIRRGAEEVIRLHCTVHPPEHWLYYSQYASGASLWFCPATQDSVVVYPR